MPYATLYQLIKNMFATELPSGAFVIKYSDDEGDLVAVSSDLELAEAVRQIPEQGAVKMLRLFLNETSPASVSISAASFMGANFFLSLASGNFPPTSLRMYIPTKLTMEFPCDHVDLGISGAMPASFVSAVPQISSIVEPVSENPPSPSYPVISDEVVSQINAVPVSEPQAEKASPASSSQLVRDINLLELIEKRLQEAFKTVSSLMGALEIDTKMVEVIDGCHKALSEISDAAQSKVVTPLSAFAKAKKADFGVEIEKFQAEIKRLQQQLKAEVEKAIASFSNEKSPAASADVSADAVVAPSVYPPVPASDGESLPENAALDDLNKLAEMGFVDRVRNLELLAKHQGDVLRVVEELLAS